MFSTSLVEPEEGISAWRLRWGWAGKTQKWACSLSVERGPEPFVGLKAVGWGSEEGVGGSKGMLLLDYSFQIREMVISTQRSWNNGQEWGVRHQGTA